MPGEFQTPPSGSRLETIIKDALSEYEDTMSPLTPQRSKIELTRITIDPELDLREESPLAQVYTEGVMPSFRRPKTPLDPQISLTTISDYLEGIQCQWIEYGRGPQEFHNHGVNPGFHQAQKIECLKAALARETNDKSTNRAKSSETEMPIKRESEEVGSSASRDEDHASNDEEPEGGNTPEENEDETSSEELSKDKGPLEYVEDKYEVDDDDEPVAHLGAMYGDEMISWN
ncbi:hypothetical protein OG21DRAFT_1490627 [Imleria badia]|nr:hypothetical protein OG21DRAFT_1490627 [Imleria badia]